jgi:hypothetical protein
MTRYLCNVSGSGKTRLLFEGLCRNWGLYFTGYQPIDQIGSSDLEKVVNDMRTRLRELTGDDLEFALSRNRATAQHRFLLVLYVRMLILRIFLECVKATADGITEEHKKLWLLIQVAPTSILQEEIFEISIDVLNTLPLDHLRSRISEERRLICILVGDSSFFCVLDEASCLANDLKEYFRSDANIEMHQPILHEVIRAWNPYVSNLIISGTGFPIREMEKDNEKSSTELPLSTDIGCFDTREAQQDYLLQYLPPGLLDPLLAERLAHWLCGRQVIDSICENETLIDSRHQFIVAYIQFLLANGFKSPHLILNGYVAAMTKREVIEEGLPNEPPLEGELKFNIKRIACGKEEDFVRLLEQFNKGTFLTTL